MKFSTRIEGKKYVVDTAEYHDISIALDNKEVGPNCFYAPLITFEPYTEGDFVGSIASGSPVNFYNIKINPHGNGTHTECIGHIKEGDFFIKDCLKEFLYTARLISVFPEKLPNGDRIISRSLLEQVVEEADTAALIIRTYPNPLEKQTFNYSGTNPPYFTPEAMDYIANQLGYKHLLVDLPSVDREKDGGALRAHKIFWNFDKKIRTSHTITELIYVENEVKDGKYLLQFQVLNIRLDASPSRPILYRLQEENNGNV